VSGKKEVARIVRKHSTIVDAKTLADFFGLTSTRIHQLAAKEGMPKKARGQFDLLLCARWYVAYLQKKIEKRSVEIGGEPTALSHERVRGLKVNAEIKEIELAKLRGEFVAIQDVRKVFVDLVLMTKARILAMPPRIATDVMGETSRVMIQAKIEKGLRDALSHLAEDGSNHTPRRA
jgi:hypothetical protein